MLKVWSSTHIKKAVSGWKGEQHWDVIFISFCLVIRSKQPIGHGEKSFFFSVLVYKTLKMKKYIWDFTQGVGKGCVAFNELFRHNKNLSCHLSYSEKVQEKETHRYSLYFYIGQGYKSFSLSNKACLLLRPSAGKMQFKSHWKEYSQRMYFLGFWGILPLSCTFFSF